ncbi:hypothetical protein C8R42DRAFT_647381 [Lentinula raphanica]|nr:hypothetical protein C8R42DRAFT_647381 [Lentinula raphanica]
MSKCSATSKGNGTARKQQKKNAQAQLPSSSNEESNPRTAAQRNEGDEGEDDEEDEDQDGEDIQNTTEGIKAKKEAITIQISEDEHNKNKEWMALTSPVAVYYNKSTSRSYAALHEVTTFTTIMKSDESKNGYREVLATSGTSKLPKKEIGPKIELDLIR